jgi:GT2 family glycosyltransferase
LTEEAGATVCAVVVTYNRRELLSECLDRIRRQSRPPERVLVVDNASTDGTGEMLAARDDVEVLALPANRGGAGGFEAGVGRAAELGHDWLWLLDDDSFAEPDCLVELLEGARRAPTPPAVMASTVRWKDGRLHPMNRPWLRIRPRGEFALTAGRGLAAIRAATFVSTLISRSAVERHGPPKGHFFLWLDDIEYTARLLRDGVGYLVPESVALHWTAEPYDTLTDARERFYFKARNQLWVLRGSSFAGVERMRYGVSLAKAVSRYVLDSGNRSEALRTAAWGLRDGLRREPR